MKIEKYATDYHRKYYLKAHIIFVCKYRKKLLQNGIDVAIKSKFKSIANSSDFEIGVMETDQDHIHILVDYKPEISITSIVRKLKQESTFGYGKHTEIPYRNIFGKNIPFEVTDILLVR